MSDILTTSLAVLQPLQQIHPRTMHSHTRHPPPLPTYSPEKEEQQRKNVQTNMRYIVPQIHRCTASARVDRKNRYPVYGCCVDVVAHCNTSNTVLSPSQRTTQA